MAKRRRDQLLFSRILIRLMDDRRMGVREAARVAGVGASTVSSWRAGAIPENLGAVRRLAKALGVSFSFLLTGEEDEPSTGSMGRLFAEQQLFSGYARISIHKLVPWKEL